MKRARVLALRVLRNLFHTYAWEYAIYYTIGLSPSFMRSTFFNVYRPINKLRIALCVRLSSISYEMEMKQDHDSIMRNFDLWVSKRGTDGYVAEDYLSTRDDKLVHRIQQVRKEISEFVRILLLKSLDNAVLETGLGNYGGTHMLWRHVFKRVVTIEADINSVLKFKRNERLDYRSILIVGKSEDPFTLERVRACVDGVDLLFIDGGHTYERVASDWSMYHNLVRPGGIVAFHDCVCRVGDCEVPKFLEDLSRGAIDDKCHVLHNIVYSDHEGISYEKC